MSIISGGLKEEMIRDRIVVGIRDQALSERLQVDPALTLEKAKTMTSDNEKLYTNNRRSCVITLVANLHHQ